MRLINAITLKLESFEENAIPPYAILSHTWGADEVSFQDIQQLASPALKEGFAKIKFTCEEALERGLDYCWVDTCCIDKTSSAELSEAINSMFNWYKLARECYAYLSDVPDGKDMGVPGSLFQSSRWFTRGWTLQELLAPKALYFFSSDFRYIGFGSLLAKELSLATGIGENYLTGMSSLFSASVSRRISWASKRVTTRKEDLAYCLMVLFDINIPLLYGEGEKSFLRLQEEIIKTSDDQTIFAWSEVSRGMNLHEDFLAMGLGHPQSVLAKSPSQYRTSGHLIPDDLSQSVGSYSLTNRGLKITLSVEENYQHSGTIAKLACRPEHSLFQVIAIPISGSDSVYLRNASFAMEIKRPKPRSKINDTGIKNLFLLNSSHSIFRQIKLPHTHPMTNPFLIRSLPEFCQVDCDQGWDSKNRILQRPIGNISVPIVITIYDTFQGRGAIGLIELDLGNRETIYHKQWSDHPNVVIKAHSIKGAEWVPSWQVVRSPRPARLAWGLEVAILDIEYA